MSSSSSSLMWSESSSSSSGYCKFPDCAGTPCAHFTNWHLEGVDITETNSHRMFVRFNRFGLIQQVEIYKDPTYFFLVAIGQGTTSPITIAERNSSNISGTVNWDLTFVEFDETATLFCFDQSTSSSSSSVDSSSTSSVSLSSESSTSEGCCVNPYCEGENCQYFSNWTFAGMTDLNSTNCRLYVGLESATPNIQQVRVYKDNALSELVAIGQLASNVSASITLAEVDSSGLSGSVTWDATQIAYPNLLILDCSIFSSSSESSSSSIDSSSSSSIDSSSSSTNSSGSSSSSSVDSSSSSSSSSGGYSSSSSTSYSSSSSLTSASTSSSSSVDSSSTSSESELNTSSSSSSSLEIWNKGKPLILGNSAISNLTIKNRLAQTVTLLGDTYEIGKVHCYLMGPYGTNDNFTLHMGIYTCDEDGKPLTQLATTSIAGSTIVSNGWYDFTFDISGTIPANGYLSFVMWQTLGDENNYAIWAYSYYLGSSTSSDNINMAWISNDSINWIEDWNVTRGLRITGTYQAFNLDDYMVCTPPGTLQELALQFGERSPVYDGTKLESGSLVLDYPNLLMSFVIDNSGSMGWNDRFGNRSEILSDAVVRLQQSYPSDILFDFVTFGSKVAKTNSVNSNLGHVMTINLDANVPTRASYAFTANSSSNISAGAIYSHNDNSYTILQTVVGATVIDCVGDGAPLNEGTLIKTSGGGKDSIVFSSYVSARITNGMIAFGFKDLLDGHSYVISNIAVDGSDIYLPSINNWELYHPSSENPSVVEIQNGPKDTVATTLNASEKLVSRRPFTNNPIKTSFIVNRVNPGDVTVLVEDASEFILDTKIDLVSGSVASIAHRVTNINTTTNVITFTPFCKYTIKNKAQDQGRVQENFGTNSRLILWTTIQLLVVDPQVTSLPVTFYLQDVDGRFMEWDFLPYDEWKYHNLFWLDETAILPVTIIDSNDDPFPNETQVVLEVDSRSFLADLQITQIPTLLTADASIGEIIIYVESLVGYVRDMVLDIMDDRNNIQTVTIEELGVDSIGSYLQFYEPLQFDLILTENAKVIVNDKKSTLTSSNDLISIELPVVDVTPIVTQNTLDPSLYEDYDLDPVSPSDTYVSLNFNRDHIQRGALDMPTIDGVSVLRILPITEDVLKSDAEKDQLAANLLRGEPSDLFPSQEELDDFDLITIPSVEAESGTLEGEDFIIETPIYLRGGYAESGMSSTATELISFEFEGFNIPGVPMINGKTGLYSKSYTIYPSVVEFTNTGVLSALQYFNSFVISFAAPIDIRSSSEDQFVYYYVPDGTCEEFGEYSKAARKGVYAGEGPYVINYIVSDRGILIRDGDLSIRIYTNVISNLEDSMNSINLLQTETSINVKFEPVNSEVDGVTVTTQPLSSIDTWKKAVVDNPNKEILEEAASNSNGSRPTEGAAGFYTDPENWTNASQYDSYILTIPIVNGKATLSIPSNDNISILLVEASYPFNNGRYEVIRSDLVFISNPLMIGALQPTGFTPTGAVEDLYEIGCGVDWKNGLDGVIEDGTGLVFVPQYTFASPTESTTDNGWAGGIFLGPHDEVWVSIEQSDDDFCTKFELEEVGVVINHSSGYSGIYTRGIKWEAIDSTPLVERTFSFKVSEGGSGYADGTLIPATDIVANLHDGFNELSIWVGEDGIQRLEGFLQWDNLPRFVNASNAIPSKTRWNADHTPLTFSVDGINMNIGWHMRPVGTKIAPWDNEVKMNTNYLHEDGHSWYGEGLTSNHHVIKQYPYVSWLEPLSIEIALEKFGTFARDGVDTVNVVAEIEWRGKRITNKFTVNSGSDNESVIDYPFPFVNFAIGESDENLDRNTKFRIIGATINPDYIDYRGSFNCYLKVTNHPDANINVYSVQTSLSRTDIYQSGLDSHTHACTVDENGEGTTTSTIPLGGSVANHTHVISDYVAELAADGIDAPHTHELRCVAVTTIQPTANTGLNMAVIGRVDYDPTNCDAYTGPIAYAGPASISTGNRMMFSSVSIPGYLPTSSRLVVDLTLETSTNASSSTSPTLYAARTPGETARGFNIKAHAYFSAYIDESDPGFPLSVSARDVDDGSRVFVDVNVFKPAPRVLGSGEEVPPNVTISGPDIVKSYMVIKVKASISEEGKYGEKEMVINVDSNLNWLPDFRGLTLGPTNDLIYINNAVSYSQSMGSSQMFDALRLSAKRIINYQEENVDVRDYKKVILLLSDGDENRSQYSLNQSVNSVEFIDGIKETPVISMRLGQSYAADEVVMSKVTEDTDGFILSCIDLESAEIDDLIDSFFGHVSLDLGKGSYVNSFNLARPSIPSELILNDVMSSLLTDVEFRYRTSDTSNTCGAWSIWKKYSEVHTIAEILDSLTMYFEYEIKLFGDALFNSPSVDSDLVCRYFGPSDFVIFFNPQGIGGSNRFLSSIHITHEADVPPTSSIQYGITQSSSNEVDTFYSDINPDEHTILLTRYNETLITDDNRVFVALNGNWPDGVDITVYRINTQNPNGQLVDTKDYSANNTEGSITFYNTQNSSNTYVISIEVLPSFRLALKVVNYGSKRACIHHVGVIYNMTERIPTNDDGSIIHTPISSRIS